ncbi:hypothetical protein ACSFA2_03570 [Variovorax sp. LT2P21]|uniref:hypothetical protein n=1 Tax=Variovorax sp. LT2P21 TaxID=3443731 RepID=UPI003F45C201
MTAVATKPRKSAPKPAGVPAAAYRRPDQVYSPLRGETADERLATLRATLQTADEKLEMAYDAAERGTPVDVLLDLINHDLLCRAAHPAIMGVEGEPYPDRAHLERTQLALFPVLAALEGAMALAVGTVLSATLAEAFNLLDWAQEEADSAALGALLPEVAEPGSAPAASTPATTDVSEPDCSEDADTAQMHFGHALALIENLADDQQKSVLVFAARNLLRFMDGLLWDDIQSRNTDHLNDCSAQFDVIIGVLAAAAQEVEHPDDACVWGISTLVELSKKALDDHIEKVEFTGDAS